MSPPTPGPPVLVTGGAGFIGSHLTAALLRAGQPVVVLDDFDDSYDPAVKRRNLAPLAGSALTVVEGDIRDTDLVERLFRDSGFESVIHLAARAGVRPSIAQAALYTSVNLDGTTCLLEAARRHGARRFVFGSSSSVYGNNEKVPFAEDDEVDHPVSPYAATKKAGELLCHAHHHLYGLDVVCLRFFTVYGPRQRPEMAIHKFARLLAEGREVEQYGDGGSARDYTYVSDIVEGILRAWQRCRGYRVYNLGGSRTITLSSLLEKIAKGLGVPKRVRVLPPQPGDVERTWADVTRARQELDWEPKVDIDRGLALFLEWLRRQGSEDSR